MMLRRVRVAVCVIAVSAMAVATFGLSTRKAVALNVNGKTTTVTTYAMSVKRLLEEQHIAVRSHDIVQSTSGGTLTDHAVVTVRNAYQTTVTVDGEDIPFWTVADSADQLIGFFKANESKASAITINIDNVYQQLTGGMVINKKGPVTVIADGKSSQAPDGKLPAAILDSKGITVGKEDKVSVSEQGSETILRVQRVTHGQETRTKVVPFDTQTIVDSSLQPGETVIRQQGENGEIQQVYNVTYVDGVAQSETLDSETTTKASVNQIVAVGPAKPATTDDDTKSDTKTDAKSNDASDDDHSTSKNGKSDSKSDASDSKSNAKTDTSDSSKSDNSTKSDDAKQQEQQNNQSQNQNQQNQSQQNSSQSSQNQNNQNNQSQNSQNQSNTSTSGRLWHPSVSQAQAYAAAAAAQRGWTGTDWDALVWIWNHESSWLWNAENPSSGAYGIPQALPPDKMGAGYRDDAAVQIDWGLTYIAGRYGSPSQAKQWWLQHNWY